MVGNMELSNLVYFSFIPIIIWVIIFLVIETLEKSFHHYVYNKIKIYIISAIICALIAIFFIILSLFVKI